jgi:carboxymethylenebutenolidase
MCDESMIDSMSKVDLSRRRTVQLLGVGSALMSLPATSVLASSEDVVTDQVSVPTPHGTMDGHWIYPKSAQITAVPGVIVWPDILSSRPAFVAMAQRLASEGYAVLLVNPYYRQTTAPVVVEGETFRDPAVRERIVPFARALTAQGHISDTQAFVAFIDAQPQTDTSVGIGVQGYCMGGPIVFRAAAAEPGRIAAVASFHGGGLVTESDNSPHLGLVNSQARFLVAIAENDHEKRPEEEAFLKEWFAQHRLEAEVEVYQGAMHGWCPLDSVAYNHEQAERAWSRLLDLYNRTLKGV